MKTLCTDSICYAKFAESSLPSLLSALDVNSNKLFNEVYLS